MKSPQINFGAIIITRPVSILAGYNSPTTRQHLWPLSKCFSQVLNYSRTLVICVFSMDYIAVQLEHLRHLSRLCTNPNRMKGIQEHESTSINSIPPKKRKRTADEICYCFISNESSFLSKWRQIGYFNRVYPNKDSIPFYVSMYNRIEDASRGLFFLIANPRDSGRITIEKKKFLVLM